ncbi:MAG: hypothetical protein LBH49_01185 [Puniceicoccales bacterium]|jgi:hypothetical protein|nr:hypothetical protein [Puniceicoccales bacterium]
MKKCLSIGMILEAMFFFSAVVITGHCYGAEVGCCIDVNSPVTVKLGRDFYDVPGDGNCGYWAIAVGNSPKKGIYEREDMLNIRRIVHSSLDNYVNAKDNMQLESCNCIKIAQKINKSIVVSGLNNDSGSKKINPCKVTIYKACGDTENGDFIDGMDKNNQQLVGVKCLKAQINVDYLRNSRYELFKKLYGNDEYFKSNGNVNEAVVEQTQVNFIKNFFDKWININDVMPYPSDAEIQNFDAKSDGVDRCNFEKIWSNFFSNQISQNKKLQCVISENNAIFIHNIGAHWVVALQNKNGGLENYDGSIRFENTFNIDLNAKNPSSPSSCHSLDPLLGTQVLKVLPFQPLNVAQNTIPTMSYFKKKCFHFGTKLIAFKKNDSRNVKVLESGKKCSHLKIKSVAKAVPKKKRSLSRSERRK